MLEHRLTKAVIVALMLLAVAACVCAVGFSGQLTQQTDAAVTMDYETALFNTEQVIEIDITMDEDAWQAMLDGAMEEEYSVCDVTVNGEQFYRVGIRPKGNTSLSAIANDPTTDRYSFKLEFDQFVDGQTCFGLDKLVLNNNYADATNMKEALVYDMFQYLGADASLYNYAKISVNGEYWGVYLALEAVEDSFLLRNYGLQSGALYKPEGMQLGGGMGDMQGKQMPQPPEGGADFGGEAPTQPPQMSGELRPDDGFAPGEGFEPGEGFKPEEGFSFEGDIQPGDDFRPENGFGQGGGFSSGGADLNYTDDQLSSYQTIWDGAVTKVKSGEKRRVITALKNVAAGNELETYLDTDALLRYMAVHIFSVNDDSLSGTMAHNYYLYESGGRLSLLPWDYNLAFGGMGRTTAQSVINAPIDDAFSATDFFDTLLADETYHSQYYAFLRQLVDEYVDGGGFDAFYTRVRSQLDTLVETDPTAFYTYDEYDAAAETLYQVVQLRASSIRAQLDGSIPSTQQAQQGASTLIDAPELDISVMGTMQLGGADRAQPQRDASPDGKARKKQK